MWIGDCCPNGYTCAMATDAPCLLTLRLDLATITITRTIGSMVSLWITTTMIDPPSTAADRVQEVISPIATISSSQTATSSNSMSAPPGTEPVNDNSLTTSQIGGLIGGVLGAALAILAGIVLLIRRRRQQRLARDRPEDPFQKGELNGDGWQRAELHEVTSGYKTSELDGQPCRPAELSSENGPSELAGRQLQHEPVGGYESHGTPELNGAVPYSRFSTRT